MISPKLKRYGGWGFFSTLAVVSIVLSLYSHRMIRGFDWKSEIWADKAGYYIYLPSFFMYRFDASKCPEKIEEKTGYGFRVDRENNRIITKYTYGVSALVAPFFVLARIASPLLGLPGEAGFGKAFYLMTYIAAIFYLLLGLFFLKKFLENYFPALLVFIVLLLIYIGTNLLYYTVVESLMSHVYSFFLFSLFLFSMKRFLDNPGAKRYFLLMCFAFGMALLIRPTNILLILLFFLWDCRTREEIRNRFRLFFRPQRMLTLAGVVLLLFLPQMFYWKYSRGSFLAWSYANESFSNWDNPKLTELWFSPMNGLFLYTPIVILMIAGMFMMIRKRIPNGLLVSGLFLFITYVFSSWYNWYYGCSYGQRSYVEYYAIFALPLGIFLREIPGIKTTLTRYLVILFVAALAYFNVKLSLEFVEFEKCFIGSTWDWVQYEKHLDRAHLVIPYKKDHSFMNDFENTALSWSYSLSDTVYRSGMYSAHIDPAKEYTQCYTVYLNDLGEQLPESIEVTYWALNPIGWPLDASLVCAMDINDSVVSWQSSKLPPLTENAKEWKEVRSKFIFPAGTTREPRVKIYFWNPQHNSFFIDDMNITYR